MYIFRNFEQSLPKLENVLIEMSNLKKQFELTSLQI